MLKTAKSLLLATLFSLGSVATAAADTFSLPPLPYAADALAPVIDKDTMQIHHGRHHQAYVNNLNGQVATFPELAQLPLEAIMARMSRYNSAVRNNGGGHYNHQLFWQVMAPPGQGGQPSPELQAAINRDFGSLVALQQAFNQAAATRFGSGWAWLIVDENNKLVVTSTANQDNPLMDVVDVQGTPLLALDVWEHAYYLQYQNKRGDYATAWWKVVNWNKVNTLFNTASN
ncbi:MULTISPECIES: superoxide dismutase [unclassified Arsukibacterium]|uniref:superoxide dismutase n=1 Tax=unclassified Arsukibacterium TaxID=2635278 RepID=UPI000C489163|nr:MULTISPECIES: superoxide dismutase [unclassified Arsukibacterium]MAA96574.1 superoxide dismutase [Rheinheimera sp.]MBM33248.1 superoxide dismutase [Rheinheimera sp.]HAW91731.1 superoxide dismutase [Candidatus Azambacteria bacterium]|tara:strand:- start:26043 stop:26732 length:690 start_codon:yes stop_codon:yes gene_type:complete